MMGIGFKLSKLRARVAGVTALSALALGGQAHALDCAKASTVAEKLVCSQSELMRADDRLNEAFAAAMKAAPDREIKDAILFSQRRWIKAREIYFEQEARTSDQAVLRARMASAVGDRTAWLSVRGAPERAGIIERIQKQRTFLSKYSGGDYAGNDVQCRMARSTRKEIGVEYICEGDATFQNGARICRERIACAHGCVFETDFRTVADVVGGEARIKAMCMTNHGNCPDDYDQGGFSDWEREWTEEESYPLPEKQSRAAARIDIDMMVSEPWIGFCLADPNFPTKQATK